MTPGARLERNSPDTGVSVEHEYGLPVSSLGDLLASLHDGPDAVRRLRAEIVSSTNNEVASAA